jgi:hypothetical protein
MIRACAVVVSVGFGVLAGACGDGGRAAAEAAVKATEATLTTVRTEAVRYVPDQVKAVEGSMAAVRDAFEKGSYTQVLSDTKALSTKISALGAAAAAKKTELTTNWHAMSDGLPEVIQTIQGRVDVLSKSRRLPKGLTTDALDSAKAGLEVVNRTWTEAADAFNAGNLADAMAKATTVKARAAEIMTALDAQVPAAPK